MSKKQMSNMVKQQSKVNNKLGRYKKKLRYSLYISTFFFRVQAFLYHQVTKVFHIFSHFCSFFFMKPLILSSKRVLYKKKIHTCLFIEMSNAMRIIKIEGYKNYHMRKQKSIFKKVKTFRKMYLLLKQLNVYTQNIYTCFFFYIWRDIISFVDNCIQP